eukprot:scaffold14.g1094.t1
MAVLDEAHDGRELAVGSRISVGGHKATVRYVGPLEGQPDEWVGLEWDDAGRGKHDGTHAGRRYFSCVHHPTAGSFVRAAKLLAAADFGRSVLDAAAERYCGGARASENGADAPDTSGTAGPVLIPTTGRRTVIVQLVGEEQVAARMAHLDALAEAVLVNQRISRVGPAAQLGAALPSLTELDLSDNLISEWSFVVSLAQALPRLAALTLSLNRLELPRAPPPPGAPHLPGLRTLVLGGCDVSWRQAVAVGAQLPSLRRLVLCKNGMERLGWDDDGSNSLVGVGGQAGGSPGAEGPAGGCLSAEGTAAPAGAACLDAAAAFSSLEALDLEGNALSSWADVAAQLGSMPRLASLSLSGNRLPAVAYAPRSFAALTSLLLGGNALSSWASVDAIDAFPALTEARLSDNPLCAADPGRARYETIARVASLASLNGSAVSAAERWDAELAYLRTATDEAAAAEAAAAAAGGPGGAAAARAAALAAHPRFAALELRYGALAPAAPPPAAGRALAKSMAEVVLACGGRELRKKLPVSLTVGRLKLMLEKLFGVKAAAQALMLVPPSGAGAPPEDITEEEGRELRYFDVVDGYRLEVSEGDAGARAAALAAAKAAATAAQAARMDAHERAMQALRLEEQRLLLG